MARCVGDCSRLFAGDFSRGYGRIRRVPEKLQYPLFLTELCILGVNCGLYKETSAKVLASFSDKRCAPAQRLLVVRHGRFSGAVAAFGADFEKGVTFFVVAG